jgi:hypothetical protein
MGTDRMGSGDGIKSISAKLIGSLDESRTGRDVYEDPGRD